MIRTETAKNSNDTTQITLIQENTTPSSPSSSTSTPISSPPSPSFTSSPASSSSSSPSSSSSSSPSSSSSSSPSSSSSSSSSSPSHPSQPNAVRTQFIDAQKAMITASKAIAQTPLNCLKKKKLVDIVRWSDEDEQCARDTKLFFDNQPESGIPHLAQPRHIVAGALMASMEQGAKVSEIFQKMKDCLISIA